MATDDTALESKSKSKGEEVEETASGATAAEVFPDSESEDDADLEGIHFDFGSRYRAEERMNNVRCACPGR